MSQQDISFKTNVMNSSGGSLQKLRIVYDANLLGMGVEYPGNRTGIFRVAEHVAEGLVKSDECQLQFFVSSYYYYNYTSNYLRSKPSLEGDWWILGSAYERILKKVEDILRQKGKKALAEIQNRPENDSFLSKVYRKSLFTTQLLLFPRPVINRINKRILRQAEIFHSPHEKIPDIVKEYKQIKNFLTIYDLIPILYPQFTFNTQEGWTKRAVESLDENSWGFSISQTTKDDLCNYNSRVDPEKIFITHLAASEEKFYPCSSFTVINSIKNKYNIPNAPYFLGLSTRAPHKNINHTIRCFTKLVEEHHIDDLFLVLVGIKGWEYKSIFEELNKKSWLKSKVIFTGYAADEDLAPLYSGSIGFFYMSLYEGFGLPPLEAMQCGVPVVTSNTSSLPEVVGNAGITVDPKDSDALCQKMLDLYSDSALRKRMSKQSIERASQFSWDKCVQQTIDGYKTALLS